MNVKKDIDPTIRTTIRAKNSLVEDMKKTCADNHLNFSDGVRQGMLMFIKKHSSDDTRSRPKYATHHQV